MYDLLACYGVKQIRARFIQFSEFLQQVQYIFILLWGLTVVDRSGVLNFDHNFRHE